MYRGMRQYKIFFFAIVFFIVIANFLFLFSIRRNLKEILLRQGYHDSFEMIERTRCLGRECFQFRDLKSSSTVDIVISEIPSDYEIINKIQFSKGDTIIDIGAHVGVVSAYIGRLNPNIKIYAIEAVPLNYQNLVYNLKINNINNVNPVLWSMKYFEVKESKVKGHPINTDLANMLTALLHADDADWFGWYDAVRNYLTKKPQDDAKKNKLKLNFFNPNLLGGWRRKK